MKHPIPHYRKTALFLTFLLVLTALGCLLWIFRNGRYSPNAFHTDAAQGENDSRHIIADLYQDGALLQSISLDTVKEAYTFTVTGENGCRNEVEVRPGSIGILSADCPDKLCVRQGFISTSLLPITCLPNHLVIQIRTEDIAQEDESSVDIVTY